MASTDPPQPPSTAWYRAAGAVLALGLVLALGWFLHALTVQTHAINDDFTDVPWFPGAAVEVAEAGEHTLWTGPACGGACRPQSAETYRRHLTVGFVGPDGRDVPVEPAAEQYFHVGSGREGRAVWLVDFEAPGTYTTRLGSDGEVPRPRLWLSPGRGLPVRTARGSLFIAGGAALIAAAMVLTTSRLRRRAFDRMPPALIS